MTIRRRDECLLLRPSDIPPSHDGLEVIGAFNPGAAVVDGEVLLLVRIAERPRERRPGFTALPRWSVDRGAIIDWVPDEELILVDPRVARRKSDGLARLTFISHLQVVPCGDGKSARAPGLVRFEPQSEMEEYGVEDPRITRLGDRYYITYVAVSRHGVATALASTTDFQSFERHGVIFCPENKDVVLFPERIGGAYLALHRPNGPTALGRPEIWLARSPDLLNWGGHAFLFGGSSGWESGKVGAGPPPIWTEEGWLVLYHGNRPGRYPGDVGAYASGALLLDPADPAHILRVAPAPIFEPESDFERLGFISQVVFPTGVVERGDSLLVYYGAADTYSAVVELSRSELLAALSDDRAIG